MAKRIHDLEELEGRRLLLRSALVAVGDFRQGSLTERYRRCGKENCHCAAKNAPGHGPSWSVTRGVSGKTRTKVIPVGPDVARTREQIAEYKRFRELTRELTEINERICDAKLASPQTASSEVVKKGASPKPSEPRSKPRSKP